jgi:multiple sugar transport system substrate-binding protein
MRKVRLLGLALLVLVLVTASVAIAQDQVTINVWGHGSSPAEEAALNAAIAAFEEANPDVNVELLISPEYGTQLQAAFASGTYPQAFYVGQSDLANYVNAGVLAEAGDNIEAPEGIYPALLNTFTLNGTLYCPAKDFSNLALEYNTDLFDAAGVEYPTADWTWDDLRSAAEALAASGALPEGTVPLALNPDIDRWFAFYVQAGGTFYDADGNWVFASEGANYDAAVQAADYYINLHLDGLSASSSDLGQGWPGESFGQAKAAMTMEGNWIIGYLNDNFPDLNWGATELPAGPAGEGTLTFSECWGVGANNPYPEQTWRFVNYLTGEEGALRTAEEGFGVMPPRIAASDAWVAAVGDVAAAFINGTANAVAPVTPPGFQTFRDELANGLALAFEGSNLAEDVVNNAVTVANELANE